MLIDLAALKFGQILAVLNNLKDNMKPVCSIVARLIKTDPR